MTVLNPLLEEKGMTSSSFYYNRRSDRVCLYYIYTLSSLSVGDSLF